MHVVIIGGGPAGIRAARTIKTLSSQTDVTVIRPEPKSLIYCAMPYVIENTFQIETIHKKDELLTDLGIKLIKQWVKNVNFDKKTVILKNGQTLSYDKLLIATGAEPIVPKFVPQNLSNVFVFKREEHLQNILAKIKQGAQKSVIVGAGSIGIEMAQAFNKINIETYLIEMADHILPNLADKDMVELLEQKITSHGIKLYTSNPVKEIKGKTYAEKVILQDGTTINLSDTDILVFSVGLQPNIAPFKESKLEIKSDGIVVNKFMETNIKDVYAAGDCTSFISGIDNNPITGKLATNAVPMGKIAGMNILGKKVEYDGFFNGAATIVYGIRIGGTGFTEKIAKQRGIEEYITGYGETTATFPIFPDPGFVRIKLIVNKKDKKLIGAQAIGTMCITERIDLLTFAIQNKVTIDKIAKLSYSAQPYQSFFPANNAIVIAAENILKQI